MREKSKKQRQQKNACNMARTENLALVTESINCVGVFCLSRIVPFVMGFE